MSARISLHTMIAGGAVGLAAVAVFVLLTGCSSAPIMKAGHPSEDEVRSRELQSMLERYARDFAETVVLAADEIVASTNDLETKRATVHWKLRVIPRILELSRVESQGEAFLGLWLYTEMMVYYLEEGEAIYNFGPFQPIAVAASRKLTDKIQRIAGLVLESDEDLAAAQAVIDDYVHRYTPRRGGRGAADYGSVEAGIMELTGSLSSFAWMPSFSLAAFNPFSGLNETATAIHDLSDSVDKVIEDMLMEFPWRMELLVYDIEGRETVRDTRANLNQISESAVSLAEAADSLPTDVEQVVKSTLEEIDTRQEGLQSTLGQAEEALMRAENVVSGLNQTAANLTSAGEAWDATFQTLGLGDRKMTSEAHEPEQVVPSGSASGTPAPSQKAGRPFDIFDYRDTAEELRSVAVELRGLVQDVNALAGERGDDAPLRKIELAVQTAASVAADEGRDLADHIAWRLIQLVGIVFLAAILYRLVVSRIAPQTAAPGS